MNKPRTAASIYRSMAGARSRAEGAAFENLINDACLYYLNHGDADIEKTPEPMKPLGGADRSGRFLACYTKQAQPDYKGILRGGRAVTFEAKHTDSGKMTKDRVSYAQSLRLASTERFGGVAFVLCSFSGNRFYRVPWAVWFNMKKYFGRKYITPADVEAYRLKFGGPGVLLFLEGVPYETPERR